MKLFVAALLLPLCGFAGQRILVAQAGPTYITVRDQRENAFSVEVPKGWKIYGGLFRYGYVDARPLVDMTSPDGMINIRMGDATIPPYTVASPYARPPAGVKTAPYASGDVFAAKYGKARFGAMCQSVQVTQSKAVPPRFHSPGGGMMRTTAGEANFSCTLNGRRMFGYVYAETFLVGSGGPLSNWYVSALGSFLAPEDQAAAVGEMLKHSADSLAYNPQWAKMQQQRSDQVSNALNNQTNATIAATEAMNAHQQAVIRGSQQQNDNFNDVINGVAFTRDTSNGSLHEVPLGQGGTQWINGNRTVVESGMSPGPGFSQLQTISR